MHVSRRPPVTVTGALAVLLLLAGCGGSTAAGTATEQGPGATHTMPDGTVMRGAEHPGGGPVHGGDRETDRAADPDGPSPAARMVCSSGTAEDVARILALDERPDPSWSWDAPFFTCTFDLPAGPLVLTVHDATDPSRGRAYFEQLRASIRGATPLEGIASYGLPAFETADGKVAFVRDGKTLLVDATEITGELGGRGERVAPDIAYAVATSVLFCWVHADEQGRQAGTDQVSRHAAHGGGHGA